MDLPVVTHALDKDADRANPSCPRIGVIGMIFVDVINNVADNLATSSARITIDAGVRSDSLFREQTFLAPLMIAHDIVANNGANAALRILNSRCSGATIGCSATLSVLNHIVLDGYIRCFDQLNGTVSIIVKGVVAYH
jgi:hypothetical protein